MEKNITDGFDPIRLPKPGERQIKALRDDEVMRMLDAVTTGEGLTKHERTYWEKTKYRDKCILMYFVTNLYLNFEKCQINHIKKSFMKKRQKRLTNSYFDSIIKLSK